MVAPRLRGPVLDVGCGDGRLASLLDEPVRWVGVDSSVTQLAANPYRPVVLADMRHLPFADDSFGEVTHLWCLYHLGNPQLGTVTRRYCRRGIHRAASMRRRRTGSSAPSST